MSNKVKSFTLIVSVNVVGFMNAIGFGNKAKRISDSYSVLTSETKVNRSLHTLDSIHLEGNVFLAFVLH